jgi:hypothetical protein
MRKSPSEGKEGAECWVLSAEEKHFSDQQLDTHQMKVLLSKKIKPLFGE